MRSAKIKYSDRAHNEATNISGGIKKRPSVGFSGPSGGSNGSVERINAHELFSFYTADVIREENVFVR